MSWRKRHTRRPVLAPAVAGTAAILHTLFTEWLQMPPALEEMVLGAVMEARWSRAASLKQHLAVAQAMRTDLDHFFLTIMTPRFTIDLMEDLLKEGLLTRQQAAQAEDYILDATTRDGTWRNDDGPRAA